MSTVARATVNPTEAGIWRPVVLVLGEWPLPLSEESAKEIIALADKWRIRGPNGPARAIELEGVKWAEVWRAYEGHGAGGCSGNIAVPPQEGHWR